MAKCYQNPERVRERRLCIWSDIWIESWKINTGTQGANAGDKDISDGENSMYDQRPEKEKTLDISRQGMLEKIQWKI